MALSIIAAMSTNRVIGLNNGLPWQLPADQKRFKALTMGHHLVVGRKTFESIGRPLPGRRMVVITGRTHYAAPGVQVAHSLGEALRIASDDDEVFIGGGGEIYRQTLDLADRIYLTLVHGEFEGDTHFPRFDQSDWRLVLGETRCSDHENEFRCSFHIYERQS